MLLKMIEKCEKKGEPTATAKDATVVIPAYTHGRKAGGQRVPGSAGGKLPENGIQQEAGRSARAAPAPAAFQCPDRLPGEGWEAGNGGTTMEDLIISLHNNKFANVAGGDIAGEMPAVGGDNGGRLASEPMPLRIRRNQRGDGSPLGVGQVGGEIGKAGRR